MNNSYFDGWMTQVQKRRLREWHLEKAGKKLDRLWETSPAFRATMRALNRADKWDITDLEYDLAGNVSGWAAECFSEDDWFEELSSNEAMQRSFRYNQIPPGDVSCELSKAITTLKAINLWPWP